MHAIEFEETIEIDDCIKQLVANPHDRKLFISLAELLEQVGRIDEASELYNGILPGSIISNYNLLASKERSSINSVGFKRLGSYKEEYLKWNPPENICSTTNSVFHTNTSKVPAEFLDVLEGGKFVYDGINKLFMDAEDYLISNHSSNNAYLLHIKKRKNIKPIYLPGYSLLLSARNSGNFYHWHFDLLPFLHLVESAGIQISDIDNLIITDKENKFHLELLKLLGFTDKQIKCIPTDKNEYQCERLLLPKVQNRMGLSLSRRHIDWLRGKLLPLVKEQRIKNNHYISKESKKVLIARRKRGFTNSDIVNSELQSIGYKTIFPEDYSYLDQLELFNSATHVVAPHGAALSLLCFCNPGTAVHEIYGEHVNPCFWTLSEQLGLKYYNHNCSELIDGALAKNGKGLEKRRDKSMFVNEDIIEYIKENS